MKIIHLFIVGLFCLFFTPDTCYSQVPEHRTCGTTEADSIRRITYPEIGTKAQFEEWIARKMTVQPIGQRVVTTIPVIVHVLHDGDEVGVGNNISFEQISSQIEVMNEDFRRLPGTPGFNNHPDGADTEIEFCLATIDTNGVPLVEPGVHRINRNDRGWNAPPYTMGYSDQVVKPQSQWNPNDYLNIWVMPLSSGLLGFAQTPDASTLNDIPIIGGSAGADGVVIRPTSFGRVGNVNAPYDLGRTTTHELGHFFGLIHTSGDGGCAFDDGCADTPTTNGQNYGCPSGEASCGGTSMIENYLEYTDDACMNVFTECQKLRMLTVLSNSPRRNSLGQSNACSQEIPPAAWFKSSATVICAGQQISFTDQSSNNPTSWTWTFQGGFPATSSDQKPTVQYSQPGLYEVSLTVTNTYGSTTQTEQAYILVNQSGPAGLFSEDFEGGIPVDWTVSNPDAGFGWGTREVAGQPSGTLAAWVNCYQYPTIGERDGLITPAIDLSYYANVALNFEHAYRRYSDGSGPASDDSLIVRASTDGGQTFPFRLLALGENGNNEFATAADTTGLFIPKVSSDWCFSNAVENCNTIDLGAFDGEADVRIMFETVNDYGNAIFLDNVLLTGTCLVTALAPREETFPITIYPNPVQDQLRISFTSRNSTLANIRVFHVNGQLLLDEERTVLPGNQDWKLETASFASGMYLLEIRMGDRRTVKRFIRE